MNLPTWLTVNVAGGSILGFLVGYALKKAVKLLLALVGIYIVSLAYLSEEGVVEVHWDRFGQVLIERLFPAGVEGGKLVLARILTVLPFGVPFVLGLLYGFKKA